MGLKLFLSLFLAGALCFYGCTTEYVYVMADEDTVTSTDEPDSNNSGDNNDNTESNPDDNRNFDDDEFYTESGEGTKENPYSVLQVLEMLNNGTYDSGKGHYVKGIVAHISGCSWAVGTEDYNIQYYMSEDGNYVEETSLFVNEGFSLSGEYFPSKEALSVGDKVIVYGKLNIDTSNYDRREIVHGKLYYWNGEFGDLDYAEYFMEHGDGTKESPYAVSQLLDMVNNGTYELNKGYYVKGIVSYVDGSLTEHVDGGWCISYSISEAGDAWIKDNFYIYYGYDLGGELFISDNAVSKFDQVIVYGTLSIADYDMPGMIGGKLCYLNGETAEAEE